MDEITIKGAKGAKVKAFFQGLHMTCVILTLVYDLKLCISHLALHFRYKYILITNWIYIMYIMHSCLLSHIYIFEPNVLKWIIKKKIISSSLFLLLIINVKILSNFQKEWCTFGRKKRCLKKKRTIHSWGLDALNIQKHFWFVPSFEHVDFAINGKYSKNICDNPNYYVSLMIF